MGGKEYAIVMDFTMATRNTSLAGHDLRDHTDFQLHINQRAIFNDVGRTLFDFTEERMIRLWYNAQSTQQKIELAVLIDDYKHGRVAIGWRRGEPVYIRITQER